MCNLLFCALSPLTRLRSTILHRHLMMSNASSTRTPAEAISVLKGMMPMLDLRDPRDNAFKMVKDGRRQRHGWWVCGLDSFTYGTLRVRCPPSIESCQCREFNSYVDFDAENLVLPYKTKGPKCTTKRALSSPKNNFMP